MNLNVSKPFGLLVIAFSLFAPTLEGRKYHTKEEVVRYVQGGACAPGKGTKKCPFTSLKEAEEACWDVLIVLPSLVALDNGITLKCGQKLIGEDNPTSSFSPIQPTITNSSNIHNGGNGAIVTGDATIENIYFKNTYASAINYDRATCLTVKNVLITGHNQGNVTSPVNLAGEGNFEVAGIHGQCKRSGTTHIENVIIRNNHTGNGIIDQPYDGAHRELYVTHCEFTQLTSDSQITGTVITNSGIFAIPIGEDTASCVIVKDSYFHDFQTPALSALINVGVNCAALEGASQAGQVDNSTFSLIAGNPSSTYILCYSQTIPPGSPSESTMRINGCSFAESLQNATVEIVGVSIKTINAASCVDVENSTFANFFFSCVSEIDSDGKQKIRLTDTTSTNVNQFYTAQTGTAPTTVSNPQIFTDTVMTENNFTGGAAIVIFASINGQSNPWNKLTIEAEHNCFNNEGSGSIGFFSEDVSTAQVGAGNAKIIAHCNTISDFDIDIFNSTNVNINATENWWGPLTACTTSANCLPNFQICKDGFCLGPDVVVNTGGGTVTTIPARATSITCPVSSCPSKGGNRSHLQEAPEDKSLVANTRFKPAPHQHVY